MSKELDKVATLAEVRTILDSLYPPELAEDWDRVGLICGDPAAPVRRILLALDPVQETVSEALTGQYDLLFTHHPLYLRGTSFVPVDDPKGKLIHQLISGGCALFNAHTNADVAQFGVAQALAEAVGLKDSEPLIPSGNDTHPGLGRVGKLPQPIPFREFAQRVANALPAGPQGLLVGGELAAQVQTIAVSGGAGDSLLADARAAGADVFLTADLRHHPASEHLEGGRPFLLCGSHWATEVVWCELAQKALQERFQECGFNIEVVVSKAVTEPWVLWLPTGEGEQ
ncbi:Nif3-like dinuclear metal center hexameric protein [Boudabousia liubingyangii]|uniref:GTP cyclohydrolase 1 type 2 homolog n=1 Tax=Boudabousia liubingyangii TaxID=1921764 RepID=A0A1Q5PL01_9ACTO|nr:Nif3-like dinuclear metal center hexameric protein [Boudabousia liubingyangii]OKL47319.1 Nif3-like dinuclear metal center hexameric protein [Boudabousia liubingyangii]